MLRILIIGKSHCLGEEDSRRHDLSVGCNYKEAFFGWVPWGSFGVGGKDSGLESRRFDSAITVYAIAILVMLIIHGCAEQYTMVHSLKVTTAWLASMAPERLAGSEWYVPSYCRFHDEVLRRHFRLEREKEQKNKKSITSQKRATPRLYTIIHQAASHSPRSQVHGIGNDTVRLQLDEWFFVRPNLDGA